MIFTRKTSNKKQPTANNSDLLDGMIDGLLPKTNVSNVKPASIAPAAPNSAANGAGSAKPKYFSALNVAQPTANNSGGVTASTVKPDSTKDQIWGIIDDILAGDDAGRQEYADQLAQSSAEATENARAQTGLAGMALSGGGAAAVGAQQRKGARESALAVKQFDDAELDKLIAGIDLANTQTAADKAFNELNREMPLRGDYPAGAEGTAQYNADVATWKQNKKVDDETANSGKKAIGNAVNEQFQPYDYSITDENAETGSKQEPYWVKDMKKADLEEYLRNIDPDSVPLDVIKVGKLTLLVDKYGNHYGLSEMNKNVLGWDTMFLS